MLVTDLDGTLIARDGSMPERCRQALVTAGQDGIVRVVATGRSLWAVRNVLGPETPLDFVVFSSGVGAVAWGPSADDSLLFSHAIDTATHARLEQYLHDRGYDSMAHAPATESHRYVYRERAGHPDLHRRIGRHGGLAVRHRREMGLAPASFVVAIVAETVPPAAALADARETFPELHVVRTTSPLDHRTTWLEFLPPATSKGRAAAWLADALGVGNDRTTAVGNDHNDDDLLAWAGEAFVVANAPPDLRARYRVVASQVDGGVADVVSHMLP